MGALLKVQGCRSFQAVVWGVWVKVGNAKHFRNVRAEAATPAIALCIAALKAQEKRS